MAEIDLLEYIRPVTDEDKDLPEYSHSRLECFENCPYQFNLKYNQNKTTTDTTLALQLGSLFHKILELKGLMLKEGKPVDYKYLIDSLDKGVEDNGHTLIGVAGLRTRYMEDWFTADTEGHDYSYKQQTFERILQTEMQDDDWEPIEFEKHFSFVYKNKIRIHGFIDRIDKRVNENGETEYRIVDYKTNKKPFDESKVKTSQQFSLYNMAMLLEYGQLASECMYRFICIDERQYALSDGWAKRFTTKFDKVLDQIDEGYESKVWFPHPSPLCHFCQYCITNPEATTYKRECDYYMKWTRQNKDFSVNKKFDPADVQKNERIKNFNW